MRVRVFDNIVPKKICVNYKGRDKKRIEKITE
jgi:hypothetical protein